MKIFNDAKIYEIKEVAETRSLKDFLLAIDSIDSKFHSVHTTNLLNIVYLTTTIEQMLTLIEMFRHVIRKKKNKASFESHFAFFVDENSNFISSSSTSSNARSKEENKRLSLREK